MMMLDVALEIESHTHKKVFLQKFIMHNGTLPCNKMFKLSLRGLIDFKTFSFNWNRPLPSVFHFSPSHSIIIMQFVFFFVSRWNARPTIRKQNTQFAFKLQTVNFSVWQCETKRKKNTNFPLFHFVWFNKK